MIRFVPSDVTAERREAAIKAEGQPVSRTGAAFIVPVWVLAAAAFLLWLWPQVTQ
ncbi:hypothetical protein [Belnapia moabensis]|uniref:hypothetical protein n=1 Tax=Belnapia moabensis TaxID=365533 RepID=UPI0012EEA7F3|nr:hypothetical protein [Belnapia moabensis]